MKKINALTLFSNLIFLILFNAVFFIADGIEYTTSAWISYGFIHFAYFMLIFARKMAPKGIDVFILKLPLLSISSIYFIVIFALGIFFILVPPESYKTALLILLIITGLYGVVLVFYINANKYTADTVKERQLHANYIKQASSDLKGLLDNISERTLKAKIENIYDVLSSSPVKSHPSLTQEEAKILMTIEALKKAVLVGNESEIISLTDSLLLSINERNRQLKVYNHE